jgi:hypothetical protein
VTVTPLPSLDELANDPSRATELPADIVLALYARALSIVVALQGSLLARPIPSTAASSTVDGNLLLGTEAVARMIGRGKSWVEHHLADLPPRRSLLGQPVWLKRDVERWIQSLPKYGGMS